MLYLLSPDDNTFPPVEHADAEGLLAVGGDLSRQRLLNAYASGIFPWFSEDEPICWWSPDPRFVLFPEELIVSKSMRPILNQGKFKFTINKDFPAVINACKEMYRPGQAGTWISDEMQEAYIDLHQAGKAWSAEAWLNGELVGGLYGIKMNRVFCGESMFSHVSNASKYTFIRFINFLQKNGIEIIDCQVYTSHLESLGARHIPRLEFLDYLK